MRGSEGSAEHNTQSMHRHGTQLIDPNDSSITDRTPTSLARSRLRQTKDKKSVSDNDTSGFDVPEMYRSRTLTSMGKLGLLAVENRRWSSVGSTGEKINSRKSLSPSVEHVLTQPLPLSALGPEQPWQLLRVS